MTTTDDAMIGSALDRIGEQQRAKETADRLAHALTFLATHREDYPLIEDEHLPRLLAPDALTERDFDRAWHALCEAADRLRRFRSGSLEPWEVDDRYGQRADDFSSAESVLLDGVDDALRPLVGAP